MAEEGERKDGIRNAILISHNGPQSFGDMNLTNDGVHQLGSPYVKITEQDGKFDSWVVLPLEEFHGIYHNSIELVRKHLFGETSISEFGKKMGVFPCEDCGYVYNWEFNLKRHRREKHAAIIKRVKCPYCGKLFVREDNLVKHVQHVHQQDERCICIHCGADFYRYHSLRRHILTKHKAVKSHKCCVCEAVFSFKWELNIHHQNTHVAEPGYPCDQCKKRFKRPQTLAEHKKFVHDGMRVICKINDCHECFNTMANFKKHKMLEHGEEGTAKKGPILSEDRHKSYQIVPGSAVNDIQCTECSEVFSSKSKLRWHVKKKHGPGASEEGIPSTLFRCGFCACTFRSQEGYSVHVGKFHSSHSPQLMMSGGGECTRSGCGECQGEGGEGSADLSVTEELLALENQAGPSNA